MRHEKGRSQEETEAGFNSINLDYVFQEDDPLSPWIEEREGPLLDRVQNSEWLPQVDTDDEDMAGGDDDDDTSSNENRGGLSPPINNNGSGVGDAEARKSDNGNGNNDERRQNDSYQEVPYHRCDASLVSDMIVSRPNMFPSDCSLGDSRRGGPESRRGRRHQNVTLEDSSISSITF